MFFRELSPKEIIESFDVEMSCESVESSTTLSSPRPYADDVNMEQIQEQEENTFLKNEITKE